VENRSDEGQAIRACSVTGGQQLAKPPDVSKVLWLQYDLTSLEVDLHHPGELNGSMPRHADDGRTVRFDPDLFDANVSEPHLVVACRGHPDDVGDGQVLRADRSIGESFLHSRSPGHFSPR